MTYDTLLLSLGKLTEQMNAEIGKADWYLFGSARADVSQAEDIDLLAICDTSEAADKLRQIIDIDCLMRPIHLSIFTRLEEQEISFIERQGCVRII